MRCLPRVVFGWLSGRLEGGCGRGRRLGVLGRHRSTPVYAGFAEAGYEPVGFLQSKCRPDLRGLFAFDLSIGSDLPTTL